MLLHTAAATVTNEGLIRQRKVVTLMPNRSSTLATLEVAGLCWSTERGLCQATAKRRIEAVLRRASGPRRGEGERRDPRGLRVPSPFK